MALTHPVEQNSTQEVTKPNYAAANSRQRLLFARIGLALFGVLLSLVFVEVLYRAVEIRTTKNAIKSDRPKRFYLPKDHLDSPLQRKLSPKAPGEFRVLVLGDSFTYGQNCHIDDTFPARLERRLNLNKPQPAAHVENWGVKGYSTSQELDLLNKGLSSKALDPDLVILEVTLNDPELEPYRVTHKYQNSRGEIALKGWLFQHWRSLKYLATRVLNTRSHRDYVSYYFNLFDSQKTWRRFQSGLRSINALLNERKIPVLVVVFPLLTHPLDEQYPFLPLHEKIQALLTELAMPSLDLLHEFYQIPSSRLQADPGHDSHPNEIAFRIATDAIYRQLVKRQLIPERLKTTNIVRTR